MRTIVKNVFCFAALWCVCVAGASGAARASAPAPTGRLPVEPTGELPDVGQLGAILGYVASDYATAVGPAGVLSAQEYGEQKGFLSEAATMAEGLPAEEEEVKGLLRELQTDAARSAPPELVVPKVNQALALLSQRHDLGRTPKTLPIFARGRQLFSEGCADCHALDGSGITALQLSTKPPDVRDPAQAGPLSPARVYAAVSYGVPGTAMPAFSEAYSQDDRWNLAFYLLALAHPGAAGPAPAPLALNYLALAARTDESLRTELAALGLSGERLEAALAHLRGEAPYVAVPLSGRLLGEARRQVDVALAQARAGDRPAARHSAIAAYLDDFEPFEPALRAKDPGLVSALERAFTALRAGLDGGQPVASLEPLGAELTRLLLKSEDALVTGSASVSFAAALAIALREGLEAALLLSALLALAVKSGRRRARLAVHLGWSGALLAGVCTWFLSGALLDHSGRNRELTEGITVLLTAALLLGASHWILAQASAKKLVSFLSRRAALVKGAGWGLGGLAFLAIYREMFEIVVFYRGLLLQAPEQSHAVLAGVVIGLLALAGVVVVFQRVVGRRLQPRPLLITCGALLCALAVVMVGEGIRALQEAGAVGQTLLPLPEVPQLGLFATVQGLTAQGLVLAGLAASLAFTLSRSTKTKPAPAALHAGRA